ncbi:hypothetical protein BU25DRAFT_423363 [Macroventuria anomochaeta]|uniref:Uncharacterized protein n=1 Tax=Macroventuria anomochaeta TaxID=301207 RepID=A0ACB6RTH1_9PLEO|nr:uncharacterized protein BU25DRAFT_423363 [Macroventuria anomochaeta]KAF2625275.1 hypothetical protein BU25DRAFT_423363 [Macroventuria anomochaeta]
MEDPEHGCSRIRSFADTDPVKVSRLHIFESEVSLSPQPQSYKPRIWIELSEVELHTRLPDLFGLSFFRLGWSVVTAPLRARGMLRELRSSRGDACLLPITSHLRQTQTSHPPSLVHTPGQQPHPYYSPIYKAFALHNPLTSSGIAGNERTLPAPEHCDRIALLHTPWSKSESSLLRDKRLPIGDEAPYRLFPFEPLSPKRSVGTPDVSRPQSLICLEKFAIQSSFWCGERSCPSLVRPAVNVAASARAEIPATMYHCISEIMDVHEGHAASSSTNCI